MRHWIVKGLLGLSVLGLNGAFAAEVDLSKAVMPIGEMLDPAVSPCQDFFKHVCGKWQAANPIPADRAGWGGFAALAETNNRRLRDLLEAAAKKPTKDSAKIGDFYASCMDEAGIEKSGLAPIRPTLAKIASLTEKSQVANLLASEKTRGLPALFNFGATIDAKDSTRYLAGLSQGGLGLPDRDYYLKTDARSEEIRKAYVAHIATQFRNLGNSATEADAIAAAVMAFETELATISLDRVKQRDPNLTYNPTSVADLTSMSPSFDWLTYFKGTDAPAFDRLNIRTVDYIKGMSGVLDKTPIETIKVYLTWGLIRSAAPYLTKPFQEAQFDFYSKTLSGVKEQLPRWQRCVRATDNALGEDLGRKFIDLYFPPKAKTQIDSLVKNVRGAFDERLNAIDWMSDKTRARAHEKLGAIEENIGYPKTWRDYGNVLVLRDDYLGNVWRAGEYERLRNIKRIGQQVDRGEWRMTTPTVNAFYSPPLNNINFPAGILQPPFFDPNLDAAINFGAIGLVIGHEITHGFDDQGSKFDAKGNLQDWWTAEDRQRFDVGEQCLADQYGSYVVDGDVKLNGKLTLGENTADNGGARIAYLALKNYLAGKKVASIDGLNPEQRFFVGFARVWCGNDRPEARRLRAQTDPHSTGDYRVNGTVSNMPEFAAAFQCKAGDPMVRPQPCKPW